MVKNRSDLVSALAGRARLQPDRAEDLIDFLFASMTEALARGESIEVRGFGRFSVRQYGAYQGRNPRSGVAIHVQPKRMPYFRAAKELRERVEASRARSGALGAPVHS